MLFLRDQEDGERTAKVKHSKAKRVLAILGGEFLRAKEVNPVLAETLAIDNSASDAASYIFIFTVSPSAALVCVQSVLY